MVLKTSVDWWKEGLSFEATILTWGTAAATKAILTALLEERLERDGKIVIDGKTMIEIKKKPK